jgi:hypothetical protein
MTLRLPAGRDVVYAYQDPLRQRELSCRTGEARRLPADPERGRRVALEHVSLAGADVVARDERIPVEVGELGRVVSKTLISPLIPDSAATRRPSPA